MRILLIHNHYRQLGGEDLVFREEGALLESRGHEVLRFTVHNDQVDSVPQLILAAQTIWNAGTYRKVRELIAQQRPAIVHVHNTLPLLSPSVYYAARAERTAVVQTLHNYRQTCPGALLYREGRICTECVGKAIPLPGVRHACYRGSRMATAGVAAMLSVHRLLGTWRNLVDLYIAPTQLTRDLFIQAGLPAGRMVVKPNFVDPDPGVGSGSGAYALFVGRLAVEKGLHTLLDAWKILEPRVPLLIVGDGPLAGEVAAATQAVPGIRWLGQKDRHEILALLQDATCLVFPSEWYETFGRVIAEAFATGTPVVAAGHGAAAELVDDGATGLHFRPGDARDLASKVARLMGDSDLQARMRPAARQAFEQRYSAEVNYASLIAIYQQALARTSSQPGAVVS